MIHEYKLSNYYPVNNYSKYKYEHGIQNNLDEYINECYGYIDDLIDNDKTMHYCDKKKIKYSYVEPDPDKQITISFVMAIQNLSIKGLLSIRSFFKNKAGDIITDDTGKSTVKRAYAGAPKLYFTGCYLRLFQPFYN